MGQITATRNLVAIKVVRHAGQQVKSPNANQFNTPIKQHSTNILIKGSLR